MAAVATRSSNNSPHLGSKTNSPKDAKKSLPVKSEDAQRKDSLLSNHVSQSSSPNPEPVNPPSTADDAKPEGDGTNKTAATNAEPLAPPPKPSQTGNADGDYFSSNHGNTNFNLEPNPFEQSFGNPSTETPGKTLLPSVASLTSPSSLLPGGTPSWGNSLRSGPLSPAMLTGPTGSNDYFGDSHFRGGFPTPNESSLRTGLTPGGGGSMFPAPSPGSQAFLNSLQSGGATPGTLDFQRTALSAAAKAVQNNFSVTSNGQTQNSEASADAKPQPIQQNPASNQADSYHDANDAANGLFMLAQANGARNNNHQFAVPGQPAQNINTAVANHAGGQSQETSPTSKRGAKNSVTSTAGSVGTAEMSDDGQNDQMKPTTRSRGKKGANTKTTAGNRRKADETPLKAPANKKAKMDELEMPDMDDSDDDQGSPPTHHENGRKMTDEEKRKNFLERNRVAALKCRQRKKQWLASLQAKVEYYGAENEALNTQLNTLRDEVMNLRTLLLSHKDCPITHQQGINASAFANLLGDPSGQHAHPYGMGMQNGVPSSMPPQGFSMPQGQPAAIHRS